LQHWRDAFLEISPAPPYVAVRAESPSTHRSPEVSTSEVITPEVSTSEVITPEVSTSESSTPEVRSVKASTIGE